MRKIYLDPKTFAQVCAAASGDPRAVFRVGELYALCETGGSGELHIHLTVVDRAPKMGGKTSLGITVLPYDVRWNLLWEKAQAQDQLPMFRKWLWDLMVLVNRTADEQHFLAAQGEDDA